jgi:putative membrane protein
LGAKGSSFYLWNPLFWTKIALFAIVAMLSIPPILQLVRWTKQAHSHPEFLPSDEEVRRIQWWLRAEMIVVVALS